MRHLLLSSSLLAAVICCAGPVTSSAQEQPAAPPKKHKVIYIVPKRQFTPEDLAKIGSQNASSTTIPLWTYFVKGYDNVKYGPGYMVGRAPYAHGHRSTTIPTYLVPVIFTFADTGTVFDPTVADPCSPNGGSVLILVQESPLFQNAPFTMNGVNMGTGQYLDAFQRGNFWSYVAGTPYQTVFSTTPTVLPAVNVTVPLANGSTQSGVCGLFGAMDLNWWDNMLQTTIIPSLASHGVGPANFPQFIFDSVVMYLNGDPSQCCALGYHNSFMNGGVFQTYSANDFDTSGAFGGDTSVMSHEIGEWLDDPNGANPVPPWGAEGQVPAGSCQNNLEVGDPLSPGFTTPTNPFSVLMPNGVTYTLQELAYFSWFYGVVSLGSGGLYSDDGTFTGYALACPPGGTH
jgi:hypothetical protein